MGELTAVLKPDGEQAEQLMKIEGKLSTVEDALMKIEERAQSDSKKLDAVLVLLTTRQDQTP